MAKYECKLTGDFDQILSEIESGILNGSMSASLEDGTDMNDGTTRLAVRVFERYSWSGGNRVSMNLTLVESNQVIYLSAITAGGSQAMFFKVNTIGEEAFLDCIRSVIEENLGN